eukprot:COSAG02_NODE_39922_length_411_cov_0.791667_1_plen_68_part_01
MYVARVYATGTPCYCILALRSPQMSREPAAAAATATADEPEEHPPSLLLARSTSIAKVLQLRSVDDCE